MAANLVKISTVQMDALRALNERHTQGRQDASPKRLSAREDTLLVLVKRGLATRKPGFPATYTITAEGRELAESFEQKRNAELGPVTSSIWGKQDVPAFFDKAAKSIYDPHEEQMRTHTERGE